MSDLSELEISAGLHSKIKLVARECRIEADDALQEYRLLALEAAADFDLGRGEARKNELLKRLFWRCKELASQARYGVELDDDSERNAAARAAAEAYAATDDAAQADAWRTDDAVAQAKLAAIANKRLRTIAELVVLFGFSHDQVAAQMGITERRVRQALGELAELFCGAGSAAPAQQALF